MTDNPIVFHGRRAGRRLSPLAQTAFDAHRQDFLIPATESIDPAVLFQGACTHFALEIGFGMGDHLLARAAAEPDTGWIGVEPFRNGVARVVQQATAHDLPNIRIWPDDVRHLWGRFPDAAFDAIYVLFPDPWPKRRHQNRRLVQPDTLPTLRRLLKPGGYLYLATDDPGYQVWMLRCILDAHGLHWTARQPKDWHSLPGYTGQTKYQRRAEKAGRIPVFLEVQRVDNP